MAIINMNVWDISHTSWQKNYNTKLTNSQPVIIVKKLWRVFVQGFSSQGGFVLGVNVQGVYVLPSTQAESSKLENRWLFTLRKFLVSQIFPVISTMHRTRVLDLQKHLVSNRHTRILFCFSNMFCTLLTLPLRVNDHFNNVLVLGP